VGIELERLTWALHKPANVYAHSSAPGKPTVNQDFVGLTYRDGNPFVQSLFYQAAIDMKGIQAMLNL
jgi:hypothetical protein